MTDNISTHPDSLLIQQYIDGDNRAFDLLLARHSTRIFNQICHTVKDIETANDLFQETFIKVVVLLRDGRYNEEGKFQGWLSRVAGNIVMDHFRHKPATAGLAVSTDDADIDILNREDLAEMPLEHTIVCQQAERDAVMIMKSLPEPQREILEMRFYRDMSFKEIAEQKGMSINTALGRMHYAVKNMRRLAERHNITLY
ncbi:MAG: sigma-70 family RNA polymerase sigma factor [Muribaculaceae bacterium]|nr:sigma-70 family RNA polymerase sigma factor [Muribaculaceae bacterium]